jgi:hypothetical protein
MLIKIEKPRAENPQHSSFSLTPIRWRQTCRALLLRLHKNMRHGNKAVFRIRIRIPNADPDPDPGGLKRAKMKKKTQQKAR